MKSQSDWRATPPPLAGERDAFELQFLSSPASIARERDAREGDPARGASSLRIKLASTGPVSLTDVYGFPSLASRYCAPLAGNDSLVWEYRDLAQRKAALAP
jgi:hypothetical protein